MRTDIYIRLDNLFKNTNFLNIKNKVQYKKQLESIYKSLSTPNLKSKDLTNVNKKIISLEQTLRG